MNSHQRKKDLKAKKRIVLTFTGSVLELLHDIKDGKITVDKAIADGEDVLETIKKM